MIRSMFARSLPMLFWMSTNERNCYPRWPLTWLAPFGIWDIGCDCCIFCLARLLLSSNSALFCSLSSFAYWAFVFCCALFSFLPFKADCSTFGPSSANLFILILPSPYCSLSVSKLCYSLYISWLSAVDPVTWNKSALFPCPPVVPPSFIDAWIACQRSGSCLYSAGISDCGC